MTTERFVPFVPRVVNARTHAPAAPVDPEGSAVMVAAASVAPTASVEEAVPKPDAFEQDVRGTAQGGEPRCCDEAASTASVRARAIGFAAEACARALHEAIARNPLFVARFVDDAIAAAGPGSDKTVRLSPIDAARYRDRVGTSVVADDGVTPGEVVVETPHGTLRATVDERAQLLVRAVADS